MKHSDFVHLHVHSQYSLLDGMIKIEDMVSMAEKCRMPSLAITDHGAMYGAIYFYDAAMGRGVKPIIGCEVYVAPGSRFDRNPAENGESNYHLILLAENLEGYKNLCALVTAAYFEGFYRRPRIDKELLEKHNKGLIATSACIQGQIPALLLSGRDAEAFEVADFYKEIFGDRFFIELQRNGLEAQNKANKKLLQLAKKMGLSVVATNDCHYPRKEDAYAHEVLLCIQTHKTMNDKDRMKLGSDEFYFKSPAEMKELFYDIPEAITNTIAIAERCNLDLQLGQFRFPKFDVPKGETLDGLLEKKAREGFVRRMEQIRRRNPKMTEKDEEVYRSRFEFELEIIRKMGFAGYFLIVSDFINWAKNNDIPVGPGRGSAVGSLLSYCLGITELDPLVYGLLFERFLNPERKSMPDIDVDFCKERREDVLKYVSEKYGGKDYVAQIITFGKMQAKGAIRDAGRALGMSVREVDEVAKLVPEVHNISLEEALKAEQRFVEIRSSDRRIDELLNLAIRIEGLTRHSSTHAAGVVISDRPLIEYMPLYKGAHDEVVTQYDMKCVERIGLIKFDFLGLKTLTVIKKTKELVERTKGVKVDVNDLDLNDEKVWDLICRGETGGVFQLESPGMRELLVRMKPRRFEDLIAAVALYRPGPMSMLDDFIQRKQGKIPIKYHHPSMKPILEDTYGIILYQEQVMQIAQVLAGYTRGEADVLRKAMGKKDVQVMAGQRKKFIEGAVAKGVNEQTATEIFDHVAKFGEYGFNKSHSAAYALVAYQTAYLKAYYPLEFMAALLSSEMDSTDDIIKYINECKDMNIEVRRPDINASDTDFTVEDGAVRFGLKAVKNVGEGAIEAIKEARKKGGPFKDLFDFTSRVDLQKVNRKVIESLIKCGAFDSTGYFRGGMLEVMDAAIAEGQQSMRDREAGQTSLFGEWSPSSSSSKSTRIPDKKLPESIKMQYEKESLGFFITGHPLARFSEYIKQFATITSDKIGFVKTNGTVRAAGVVLRLQETRNKRNELMAFVSVEDLHGVMEVVVWADLYKETSALLKSDEPVLIIGKLDSRTEKPKILAENIIPLKDAPLRLCSRVKLRVQAVGLTKEHLLELKAIIRRNPGRCPIYLHFIIPGRSETIMSLPDKYRVQPGVQLTQEIEKLFGKNVLFMEAS